MKLKNLKLDVAELNTLFNGADFIQIIDRNIKNGSELNYHTISFNDTVIIVQTVQQIDIDVYVSEYNKGCGTVSLNFDGCVVSIDFRYDCVFLIETSRDRHCGTTLYRIN